MKRKRQHRQRKSQETGLALIFAGVIVASCATVESPLGPIGNASAPGTPGATKSGGVVTFGDSEGQVMAAAQTSSGSSDIDCPSVTVRTGAAAWQISSGSGPNNVRYQGSLGQLARECAVLGETMTMRVGVEGRILVGPQGGAGNVNVPLRIALVAEGPTPRPIWSKFYSVPVAVPPNASQAIFSQVEDDLTFPIPAEQAGRQLHRLCRLRSAGRCFCRQGYAPKRRHLRRHQHRQRRRLLRLRRPRPRRRRARRRQASRSRSLTPRRARRPACSLPRPARAADADRSRFD